MSIIYTKKAYTKKGNLYLDKKNKLNSIINIILLIVSVGILVYFCINNNNLLQLMEAIPKLDHFWLMASAVAMFMSWLFDSLVLREILSDVYHKKYSLFMAFKLTMTGQYFSAVTPLGAGGQPMQILYLTKQGLTAGSAISILVRKFLIYQSGMAIYSLITIVSKFSMFGFEVPGFITLSLIGFISQCFIVGILILFYVNKDFTSKIIFTFCKILSKIKVIKDSEQLRKKTENQLNLFIENNNSMRKNKYLTLKLYLFTFLQFTSLFSVPFFIYKAFGYRGFPIIDMIATQAFVTMISSYTPLPGSAGTYEGSFIMLFRNFFGYDSLPLAMILCRLITYCSNIVVGFIVIKCSFVPRHRKSSAG